MTSEMEIICCTGHLQFLLTFSKTLSFFREDLSFSNMERLPLIILRSPLNKNSTKFYIVHFTMLHILLTYQQGTSHFIGNPLKQLLCH